MTTKEIYIAWEVLKSNKSKYTAAQLKNQQNKLRSCLKRIMRPTFYCEDADAEKIKNLLRID